MTSLNTFHHASPAYVYSPIPPPGPTGHAAATWSVETPLATVTVSLRVPTDGSAATVSLTDAATGAAFADAPLPGPSSPGRPYSTVVDAAIDSSRNFAVRVRDADTGRVATLGLGFHERGDAAAFLAALGDSDSARQREAHAVAAKADYESRRQEQATVTAYVDPPADVVDRTLKGSVKLAVPSLGGARGGLTVREVEVGGGLPPPPTVGKDDDAHGDGDDWGEFQG